VNRVGCSVVNLRHVFFIIFLGFSTVLGGCATVVMDGGSGVNSASTQQNALKLAAADVAAVNWPKPTSVSMGERLSGIVAGPKTGSSDHITKKQAVAIYVAKLQDAADAQAQLVKDAEGQLRAADVLVNAAENAADAAQPAMSDVAIVEMSMSELRQSRDIYLESLTFIALDEASELKISLALKSDFNRAIKEIGEAADGLADRVANDRTRTMSQTRSNFTG